jgi:hypothetical protein
VSPVALHRTLHPVLACGAGLPNHLDPDEPRRRFWSSATSLMTSRTICFRSAAVVVAACHNAGKSSPRDNICWRSVSAIEIDCSRRHTSYSCSICSARRSLSSQTRSRERATRRFSGSTASYCRRARSASYRARSRFNDHCRSRSRVSSLISPNADHQGDLTRRQRRQD